MSSDPRVAAFSDPLLRAAVGDALRDVAPNAALTAGRGDAVATFVRHWALAGEMGWTAALVGEDAGGLGLGLPHIADICEEMGRHLFCGPFIETAVLLPMLAGAAEPLAGLLPAIVAGKLRCAYAEPDVPEDGEWRTLSIAPVEHVPAATHLVCLDERHDGLRVVFAELGGAAIEPLQPMDPTAPVGRVSIEAGASTRLELPTDAAAAVLAALHVAVAADLLGAGEAALARTIEHVRTRKQFGRPIGTFQAIKHRLADVHTALGCARLAIAHAARDGAAPGDARIARVAAADAALAATAAALQLHGGSGFSWEVDLHLYLKRARRLDARNGGTSRHRAAAGDEFIDRVLAAAC